MDARCAYKRAFRFHRLLFRGKIPHSFWCEVQMNFFYRGFGGVWKAAAKSLVDSIVEGRV